MLEFSKSINQMHWYEMTNDWMVWSVRVPTDPSHRRHSAHALVAYDRSLPQDEADLLLTLASYQCVSGEWLQREACGRGGIIILAGWFLQIASLVVTSWVSEWYTVDVDQLRKCFHGCSFCFKTSKYTLKFVSFKSTCNSTLGHLSYFTRYTMQQSQGLPRYVLNHQVKVESTHSLWGCG